MARNRDRTELPHLRVESGARGIYDANTNDLRSMRILMVVVALVLLIVCANVANLLLSRAAARQKELSGLPKSRISNRPPGFSTRIISRNPVSMFARLRKP